MANYHVLVNDLELQVFPAAYGKLGMGKGITEKAKARRGEGWRQLTAAVVKQLKGDLNCLVISCWTNMGSVNKKPRICVDTRWTSLTMSIMQLLFK